MGSCVDDRNIRGNFNTIVHAFQDMAEYDKLAGHFNNVNKLVMSSTTKHGRKMIQQHNLGTTEKPEYAKYFNIEKNVGDYINTTRHNARDNNARRNHRQCVAVTYRTEHTGALV